MTREETLKIMTILKVAYPMYYRNANAEESEMAVKLWQMHFAEFDYNLVACAINAFIATDTKGFPPVIAQIKEKIINLTKPPQMTAIEAWERVLQATQRSTYHAQEEFDKLPPTLQRLVGSPRQLREWAMMNADIVNSVVASNFQKSYNVRAEQERELEALPTQVKNLLGAFTEQFKLTEGENK